MPRTVTGFILTLSMVGIIAVPPVSSQPTGDFDIYVVDVTTGDVQRVTSITGAGEFNPSFSNNGMTIVHDVVVTSPSFAHDLYLTDVGTGVSTPLAGGDGGNDASFSPNGQFIAFDRSPVGDPSLYYVPSSGGTRTLFRVNAVDPDWAPNSQRVVFTDITDGSVRTVHLSDLSETVIAASGLNPAWSPNGRDVAFTDGNSLFVVPVSIDGVPLGTPIQLTADGPATFNGQPSWANNSRTVVFHSNRGGADFDIWTIDYYGTLAILTGLAGSNDFDPAYSNSGQYVAYAGFTAPPPAKQIAESTEATPGDFRLAQNYPNPFNPTTTITYELPSPSEVSLRVYNVLGKEVFAIVSGAQPAGKYEVLFDAEALPSGIYVYRLAAEGFVQTKRMMVVK